MKCNKCKSEIPNNSKFCLHCGAKVELIDWIVCSCGYKNPLDATFCTECGNILQNSLKHKVQNSNDLDENKYHFLQFRGIQIFGSLANVENKLCNLGYKKINGLFVGSYVGYENCSIEVKSTGVTKHINELIVTFDPSYDGFLIREKIVNAIRTKFNTEERKVKKGITFDTIYGTINLHVNTSYHANRLEVRFRGFDSVYIQYDSDKEKLRYNKDIADIIQGL